MAGTRKISVRLMFGNTIQETKAKHIVRSVDVSSDGKESIAEVKEKVAAALGGKVPGDQLLVFFGPNEKKIGKQYLGDPAVDEHTLRLADFSVLGWLEKFPHWNLGVRMLPPTPPPPGVATHRAAALSEGKDPDKAVADARNKGEIPTLLQLSAPWGPKPYVPAPEDSSYKPPLYPAQHQSSITAS